MQELLIILQFL